MTEQTVVIDHRSGYMKSGFSGWNAPQLVLPTIVNYGPCREDPGPSSAQRRLGLGIDLLHPDTFSYPIQRGRVLNWEGVEQIWSFVLQKHRLIHEDTPVLVTESPLKERKKTLEIMFELLYPGPPPGRPAGDVPGRHGLPDGHGGGFQLRPDL
ncbi:Actin-like protein 8 [Myotis davidii]|uniref:Actin-like protein 8 n=1 Tax=Myotis davidii TaxID=225400 RepID=L5LIB4_MYODS|nr:Actin-like protein 8 [Myotis davidii]